MNDLFEPAPAKREIYFEVPGEVRGKGRPRTRVIPGSKPFATIYTDAATKKYEMAIANCAMQAKGAAKWAMVMDETPLRLDVMAIIAIPKSRSKKLRAVLDGQLALTKPDADNIIKSIADAIQGVLVADDKNIAIQTITKRWTADINGECLKVRLSTCV